MPNSKRIESKRKLNYAVKDMAKAMKQLKEVSDIYYSAHPDISQPLDQIAEILMNMYLLTKKISDSF